MKVFKILLSNIEVSFQKLKSMIWYGIPICLGYKLLKYYYISSNPVVLVESLLMVTCIIWLMILPTFPIYGKKRGNIKRKEVVVSNKISICFLAITFIMSIWLINNITEMTSGYINGILVVVINILFFMSDVQLNHGLLVEFLTNNEPLIFSGDILEYEGVNYKILKVMGNSLIEVDKLGYISKMDKYFLHGKIVDGNLARRILVCMK